MIDFSNSLDKTDLGFVDFETNKYIHRELFGSTAGDIPDYRNDDKAIETAIQNIESRGIGQEYREMLENWYPKILFPTPSDKAIALAKLIRIKKQENCWR